MTTRSPLKAADGPGSAAGIGPGRLRIRLFDADRTDQRLELGEALRLRMGPNQLLWIDASGPLEPDALDALNKRLRLGSSTVRALRALESRPHIAVHGAHLHLRVLAEPGGASHADGWVDIVVARSLVLTAHAGQASFLERFDDRIKSDATVGRLTATSFLRSLLDAVVTTYFEAVDAIEDQVDGLDTRSLQASADEDILPDLVDVRRRIMRLRRLLSDHREVYAALDDADVSDIADADDEGFGAIAGRFEDAIHSVEDSRDLLLGSFDVFMSRLSQRTNDAMKVLALATVLLLPGSLIAGLLGMNVAIPVSKDDPSSFWYVLIGIAVLAGLVLVVAWRSGWIRIGVRKAFTTHDTVEPDAHAERELRGDPTKTS